jgi:drug/metabolite transporter (DMT)-like permease
LKYSKSHSPSALSIWAAMLSVYIIWGSTYLAIRLAIDTMPPFLMASARFLIAGAVLYGWRRLAGDEQPKRLEWRSAAVVGLLLLLGGNGGVVWAEQIVPTGITALMVGSAPLWMVLLDALNPKKSTSYRRPGWVTLSGVAMGFLGIFLLVGPEQLTGIGGGVNPLGAGVLTLAAFLWGLGSVYSRDAALPASPLLGTGMEMLVGGAGLLVLGSLTGEWNRLDLLSISWASLLSLAYLIIFGSLVGFASYTWLLRVAPTALVSTYAYVNPLVAIFLGSLFVQEPITLRVIISAGVILSGVALITLTQPVNSKKTKVASQ